MAITRKLWTPIPPQATDVFNWFSMSGLRSTRYGIAKAEAHKQLDDFTKTLDS